MSKLLTDAKKVMRRWSLPPETFALESDEIHVWRAFLDLDEPYLEALRQTLSGDEIERANRFYFRKDREDYIAGRGLLRIVLARYLETDASRIQFRYNAHGKPALAGERLGQRLCFNISHSHGLALFAVVRERNIGVDVEHVRPQLADEYIIEQSFSLREIAALRSLPGQEQTEAFFACWTRKEAYLKARGIGLASEMDQFEVPVHLAGPGSFVGTIEPCGSSASRWAIWHLAPALTHIGAVVAEGSDCKLTCRQLEARDFLPAVRHRMSSEQCSELEK